MRYQVRGFTAQGNSKHALYLNTFEEVLAFKAKYPGGRFWYIDCERDIVPLAL